MLEASLDGSKNEAIHDGSDCDNEDHHGNYLVHVVEIASHHQELTKAEADKDHFTGD